MVVVVVVLYVIVDIFSLLGSLIIENLGVDVFGLIEMYFDVKGKGKEV